MPGATAGGQQRPGCALGLRPRTHSCRGGKLTAGHCCSSAGPPSVAVRQSGRHQERPSPKGGPPRHRAGARPPREQAQLSRAEGVRGAEPGVLGDTPTAAGWPIRPRFGGAPPPREAQGTRGVGGERWWTGRGRDRQEGARSAPPRRGASPPAAHLLLDLRAVGQRVLTAVVDSHIAGWKGGGHRRGHTHVQTLVSPSHAV